MQIEIVHRSVCPEERALNRVATIYERIRAIHIQVCFHIPEIFISIARATEGLGNYSIPWPLYPFPPPFPSTIISRSYTGILRFLVFQKSTPSPPSAYGHQVCFSYSPNFFLKLFRFVLFFIGVYMEDQALWTILFKTHAILYTMPQRTVLRTREEKIWNRKKIQCIKDDRFFAFVIELCVGYLRRCSPSAMQCWPCHRRGNILAFSGQRRQPRKDLKHMETNFMKRSNLSIRDGQPLNGNLKLDGFSLENIFNCCAFFLGFHWTWNLVHKNFWGRWLRIQAQNWKIQNGASDMVDKKGKKLPDSGIFGIIDYLREV